MKKVIKQLLFFGELFLPIFIMMIGGFIMVAAGVNDCVTCPGIFQAMNYMEWYGNIGAAITIIGFVTLYWRPWKKW